MAVYVDPAIWTRSTSKKPRKTYGHMVADSVEELHTFAAKVGVKRHFFERSINGVYHYDITSDQREVAVQNGAQQVSARELLEFGKLMGES